VDSTTTEEDSHGFIAYRVKPLKNVSVGDTIPNRASIYFDFNLPIVTNIHRLLISNEPGTICTGNSISYDAGYNTAIYYQWELNNGNDFVAISNNSSYTGATASMHQILALPLNWHGSQYRCKVYLNGGSIVYSKVYTLKIFNSWKGTVSAAWEDPANWSCGVVPDANTDVFINASSTYQPEVNTGTATCRSLHSDEAVYVWIKAEASLDITGKD
jgi:hypothetical protein